MIRKGNLLLIFETVDAATVLGQHALPGTHRAQTVGLPGTSGRCCYEMPSRATGNSIRDLAKGLWSVRLIRNEAEQLSGYDTRES